jgi:putative ABC transport system permease protein
MTIHGSASPVLSPTRNAPTFNEMNWAEMPTVYRPLAQHAPGQVNLLVRTSDAGAIGQRIAALDPGVPVGNVESAQHLLAGFLAYPRFRAVLLGAFSAIAMLLAAVGLYGVLAQMVAQRTREIGVRMAIGASGADVLRMVAVQGMRLAALGVILGLGAAWILTRMLGALLYGVTATDPRAMGLVSAILLSAAFLAAVIPARRATRVHPMVALRHD